MSVITNTEMLENKYQGSRSTSNNQDYTWFDQNGSVLIPGWRWQLPCRRKKCKSKTTCGYTYGIGRTCSSRTTCTYKYERCNPRSVGNLNVDRILDPAIATGKGTRESPLLHKIDYVPNWTRRRPRSSTGITDVIHLDTMVTGFHKYEVTLELDFWTYSYDLSNSFISQKDVLGGVFAMPLRVADSKIQKLRSNYPMGDTWFLYGGEGGGLKTYWEQSKGISKVVSLTVSLTPYVSSFVNGTPLSQTNKTARYHKFSIRTHFRWNPVVRYTSPQTRYQPSLNPIPPRVPGFQYRPFKLSVDNTRVFRAIGNAKMSLILN